MWRLQGNYWYYYRPRKVKGKVIKDYFGRGSAAERQAVLDALQRDEREGAWQVARDFKAALMDLDDPMQSLFSIADMLGRASLLSVGFYQHARDEWRRRGVVFGWPLRASAAKNQQQEIEVAATELPSRSDESPN